MNDRFENFPRWVDKISKMLAKKCWKCLSELKHEIQISAQFMWNNQYSVKALTQIMTDIFIAEIQKTVKSVYTLSFGNKASLWLHVIYSCYSPRRAKWWLSTDIHSAFWSFKKQCKNIACGEPFRPCELHLTIFQAFWNCSSMKISGKKNKNKFMKTHIFCLLHCTQFSHLSPLSCHSAYFYSTINNTQNQSVTFFPHITFL